MRARAPKETDNCHCHATGMLERIFVNVGSNWNELTAAVAAMPTKTTYNNVQRAHWDWKCDETMFFFPKWAENVCVCAIPFCFQSSVGCLTLRCYRRREKTWQKNCSLDFESNEKDRRMRMRHSSVSIYCDCTPTLRHWEMCTTANCAVLPHRTAHIVIFVELCAIVALAIHCRSHIFFSFIIRINSVLFSFLLI